MAGVVHHTALLMQVHKKTSFNWSHLTDVGKFSDLVNLYNSTGDHLPGDLGFSVGEAVPYLSYALAMRNFADNPEQAMLTAAGTYVGEAFNDELFRSVA
jgi:hypothetical protein